MRFLLPLLFLVSGTVRAQGPPLPPLTDLFQARIAHYDGRSYLNVEPDTMPGDAALNARCAALWPSLMYLHSNYSETFKQEYKLNDLLPDTAAVMKGLKELFEADTAFERIYGRALNREMVAPLSIDSALLIAAHFYYLHSMEGRPAIHLCVGINEVQKLANGPAFPYHAAFCYLAIYRLDDPFSLMEEVKAPYSKEFKEQPPTEARILEVQRIIYDGMERLPALREALIKAYAAHAEHLNFVLRY